MASELLLNLTDREKEGGEMEKGETETQRKKKEKRTSKSFPLKIQLCCMHC